jgi:hypothetical protein
MPSQQQRNASTSETPNTAGRLSGKERYTRNSRDGTAERQQHHYQQQEWQQQKDISKSTGKNREANSDRGASDNRDISKAGTPATAGTQATSGTPCREPTATGTPGTPSTEAKEHHWCEQQDTSKFMSFFANSRKISVEWGKNLVGKPKTE